MEENMAPEKAQGGGGLRRPLLAKVAVGLGLLIVVFLAGYVPPMMRASRLADENARLEDSLALARVLGYLGMANYEVQRNNYASAAEYSTQLFNRAREAIGTVRGEASRQALQAAIDRRDEITAGLASANPVVKEKLAAMYSELFKAAVGPDGRGGGN
jgi:hypothetical protein